MEKTEIEKILEMIKRFEALKKAKKKYQTNRTRQLADAIALDLVDVEDCVVEYSRPEDGLGGNFFPPTGAFRQDLMCDVQYALKSPKPEDTNTLIQQFKKIRRRLEIKTLPAEAEQNITPAKRWRIWTLVKEIPRWIYVLVIFLAALLTCIYFLWWLWTTFSA